MNYNLKVSLNLSHSWKKFSDRINEVKSAAPYLKYSPNPEIDLFSISLNDKDEVKIFFKIIRKNLEDIKYLPLKTRGWRKQKKGDLYRISFQVETSDKILGIFSGIKNDLEQSGISGEINYCNPENKFDIFIAESKNYGDIEFLWEKLEEKTSIFSQILLRTLYLRSERPIHNPRKFCYSFDILNITIYRDDKKYHEYSLPCEEWIRSEDKSAWKKTYENYRTIKNYQLTKKRYFPEDKNTEKLFAASDLHLDHRDIIGVTSRPFRINDLKVMNEVLISNWNNTVNENDTVIFTGDLTYNSNSSESQQYLERLNGKIIFIHGNHDSVTCNSFSEYELKYKNYKFFFVHDPKNAPLNYEGWIIHGHTHNSRMCEYPFINFTNKTINISCELTEYRPVELQEIINIIEHYEKTGWKKLYGLEKIHNQM